MKNSILRKALAMGLAAMLVAGCGKTGGDTGHFGHDGYGSGCRWRRRGKYGNGLSGQ